jgi:hypothetical protein
MRYGPRIYDRSDAGLGTGKARRYFASDFDRLSDRVFDASEIAAVEVGVSHDSVRQRDTARAARYSNAVLDRAKIGEVELHEETGIGSTS